MKKLVVVLLLIAAGYYYYDRHQTNAVTYALAEVEQKPVPKKYFYKLLHEAGLKTCNDAQTKFNITEEACREAANNDFAKCEPRLLVTAPEMIDSKTIARSLAKEYVACVRQVRQS